MQGHLLWNLRKCSLTELKCKQHNNEHISFRCSTVALSHVSYTGHWRGAVWISPGAHISSKSYQWANSVDYWHIFLFLNNHVKQFWFSAPTQKSRKRNRRWRRKMTKGFYILIKHHHYYWSFNVISFPFSLLQNFTVPK